MHKLSLIAIRVGLLAFLLSPATSSPGNAFVGQVDNENRFPFVVRLNSSAGSCSGVVAYNGIVATAAHCVWNENGLARNMTVSFVDAKGRNVRANAIKIFMPDEFKKLYSMYKAGQSAAILTYQDIAFVIPDRIVEPIGYPHWITEILVPNAAEKEHEFDIFGFKAGPGSWTPELRRKLDNVIGRTFGPLNSARAVAVGYGNFLCTDYDAREADCISDDKRRFGEIPINADIEVDEKRAPWIWCTGRDVVGINPVQHGDSGGPVFVRALDGRWLFAGFTSNGSSARSCASSILSHLALYAEAASWFEEYTSTRGRFEHSAEWREAQIGRFIEELFESWSSPNDEALLRLKTFYLDDIQFYGKRRSFDEILKERRQFVDRWTQRDYRVRPGTIEVLCNEFVPDKFCSASAVVDWRVTNPMTGASRQGTSRYNFDLNVWNLHYGYGGDRRDFDPGIGFPPHITGENGSTLSRR
jgi:trypsin